MFFFKFCSVNSNGRMTHNQHMSLHQHSVQQQLQQRTVLHAVPQPSAQPTGM